MYLLLHQVLITFIVDRTLEFNNRLCFKLYVEISRNGEICIWHVVVHSQNM